MSGMKKSTFRKAGGFLNNVDGMLADYQFTVDPPFTNAGGYIYATLHVKEDGAVEPVETSLFVGGTGDDFTISEDGHALVPTEAGKGLGGNTAFAKFITSMEEAATSAGVLTFGAQTDDDDKIDFSPILGTRNRFKQAVLSAEEIADLKRRGKATTRKSADGREFPLTNLIIETFYSVGAKSVAKGGKPKAADLTVIAADVLKTILAAQPGTKIVKSKLATKVLQEMLKRPEKSQKEDVRKFLFDDENLAAIDGVDYDSETEMVSLAA